MANEISRFEEPEGDDEIPPNRLLTGQFEVDYTVHLDSGGYIRIIAKADMLITKREERDFVIALMSHVQNFENERGIEIEGA